MGQSLSSAQLKPQLLGELGIYDCYLFNKTATHGDSACCAISHEVYIQLLNEFNDVVVPVTAVNKQHDKNKNENETQLTYRLAHFLIDNDTLLVRFFPKHYHSPTRASLYGSSATRCHTFTVIIITYLSLIMCSSLLQFSRLRKHRKCCMLLFK
jgi:hypothetical protein